MSRPVKKVVLDVSNCFPESYGASAGIKTQKIEHFALLACEKLN